MILFLDTSALVKLYIAEPGSERMRETASRGEPVAASDLAFAEIHATFARRGREEFLQATELEEIRAVFAEDWERLTQIPLGATVLELVPRLCQRHPLRGADAVHLASALLLHEEGLEVTFACSDHKLLGAATAEGLTTLDPTAEEQA
ncbi:MAG TPA: type II toxin-antitoxin system VapC family toxin [Thermoanaerobaculia bacterium]|nr:type II toxin-antitoxin system VapC family toxin [Thermoanaerobaculia bacterium]